MFETSLPSSGGVHWGPVAVILLFLVLVIIALAVFLIYSAIYRHRINRALRQETPVGPTPEPRNAGKIILIALVGACVLWFLIWTVNQQKRLAKLEENISAQMSEMSEMLDERFDQQEEAIRRLNSPFAEIRVDCIDVCPETRTMDLMFTVMTKGVSEDTAVRMHIGGSNGYSPSLSDDADVVEMEQFCEGGFSATLTYPLFNGNTGHGWSRFLEEETVSFELTQNGVKQTDTFTFKNSLWLNGLAVVFYDTKTERYTDESFRDAVLVLNISDPQAISGLSLCLIENTRPIASLDLSEYLEGQSGTTYVPLRTADFQALEALGHGECCLQYTDSYGFIHRRLMRTYYLPDFPEFFDDSSVWEFIYDADDNQLGTYIINWKY